MSKQPDQADQPNQASPETHEPLAPHVLEDDQTVPPRPEEELADAERTDPGHSDPEHSDPEPV